MTVETAATISQLNPALPATTDPELEGQKHICLIKSVLQLTFPGANGPITGTPAQLNAAAALTGALTLDSTNFVETTAPAAGDNSAKIATTSWVAAAVLSAIAAAEGYANGSSGSSGTPGQPGWRAYVKLPSGFIINAGYDSFSNTAGQYGGGNGNTYNFAMPFQNNNMPVLLIDAAAKNWNAAGNAYPFPKIMGCQASFTNSFAASCVQWDVQTSNQWGYVSGAQFFFVAIGF